jgi:hypothetical protein
MAGLLVRLAIAAIFTTSAIVGNIAWHELKDADR